MLDLLVKLLHTQRLQLRAQHGIQRKHRCGSAAFVPKVARADARQLVAAFRRIEQVGRQRRVEHDVVGRETDLEQQADQILAVVRDLRDAGGKETTEQRLPVVSKAGPLNGEHLAPVAEAERVQPLAGGQHGHIFRLLCLLQPG